MNNASALCLRCGLCCDGTIFRDVELLRGDSPTRLKALGLAVRTRSRVARFPQPCAGLQGCACALYESRPSHCRTFDCLVLKRVKSGAITHRQAVRKVLLARRLAESARAALDQLGESSVHLPLRSRFLRLQTRFLESRPTDSELPVFADLTGRFHQLQWLLSQEFYREDPVSRS